MSDILTKIHDNMAKLLSKENPTITNGEFNIAILTEYFCDKVQGIKVGFETIQEDTLLTKAEVERGVDKLAGDAIILPESHWLGGKVYKLNEEAIQGEMECLQEQAQEEMRTQEIKTS
jgi:hypothetical protein